MSVIDIAKTLISFDTSGPPTKEKPLAQWINDYLENLGFNSTIQEVEKDRANVVAKIGEDTSPGLVLSGHIDVVPAGDLKHWTVTDPCKPKIVDGKLYGRGAADMKGPDACILKAAEKLVKEDFKRQLTLSFTAGEDTGGWFVTNILEKELITPKDAKYGVVAEPSMMQIVRTHKGSGRAQVIINGRAAHSSVPELGINAIYKAMDFIQEIKTLQSKLTEDKHPLLGSTTIKPTLINGGFKNNIIPDKCEINLNLRAIPKHTGAKIPRYWLNEIIERLKEKDPEFNATILSAYTRPALNIPEKSEIVQTLKEILGTEIIGVPYYTEAITYTEKGIPTIVCGPGNIDQAHKPNEYITLNQLKKAVKSFELLIKKTCLHVS